MRLESTRNWSNLAGKLELKIQARYKLPLHAATGAQCETPGVLKTDMIVPVEPELGSHTVPAALSAAA